MFVATKLYHDADKANVREACLRQLKSLQLEYFDLYLVNWTCPEVNWERPEPIQGVPMIRVWQQMEELVSEGLVKSIGLCNCTPTMLLDILTYAKIKPAVN